MKQLPAWCIGGAMLYATVATSPQALAQALSAGGGHTLGINDTGQVIAWGNNGDSQVSDSPGASGYIAVSAGGSHSLALQSNGMVSVIAWGRHQENQIDVPGSVNSPSDADVVTTAISAGSLHSLALRSDGSVVAWGSDSEDQHIAPPLNSAIAISAGGAHSLALLSNKKVVGWGATPSVATNSLENVIAISAGGTESLALHTDGTVSQWGGDAENAVTLVPEFAGVGANAVAISAGFDHFLGLRTGGSVEVWGSQTAAMLTLETTNKDFVFVTAGTDYSYGVKSDGSIVSWGDNTFLQRNTPNDPEFKLPTETNWTTGTDGDYLNSHKWAQAIPSTALSNANFEASGSYKVSFGNDAFALGLNVQNGQVTFDQNGNAYTVTNAIDITNGGSLIVDGPISAANVNVSNASLLEVASNGQLTASGMVTNVGTIEIGGSATLTTDSITNTGTIEIASGGTLSATSIVNNGTLTGTVSITDNTRLSGNGILGGQVTIDKGGTLAPGASVGQITTTPATSFFFGENGVFEFEVNDAVGVPGGPLGWDFLNISGTLAITATSLFTIDIDSLTPTVPMDVNGPADNFVLSDNYNWEFVRTSEGITGFNANLFAIDSTGFSNPINGDFSISQVGNSLFVNYVTAVPEPSSFVVLGVAGLGVAGYRRRRQRKEKLAEGDGKLGNASAPSANVV